MNFVFLMDPLEKVIFEKDTTYILMFGAHRKGHDIYFMAEDGIVQEDGHFSFHVNKVIPQENKENPFKLQDKLVLKDGQVDSVFIRTDPPFNYKYLMHTWLLDKLPERIVVINDPSGIRTVNEKVWATQFTSLVPPTFVGRKKEDMIAFIKKHKSVIVKPTDGFGGQGIFRVVEEDLNTNVILETVSDNFSKDIILQELVKGAAQGDKRIILLNGEPLGAVLRVHPKDDHRNNFFSGGKPVKSEVTAADKEIIEVLKPHLVRLGLYLVGIDILGNKLIEVNVTSPTCIQEINRLDGKNLENDVIEFVENLVAKHKTESKMSV